MEQLYKYISENTIQKASNPIHDIKKGIKISNPTEEILREYGYKPLIDTEYPETEEGYYRTFKYIETENKIVKIWGEPIFIEMDNGDN